MYVVVVVVVEVVDVVRIRRLVAVAIVDVDVVGRGVVVVTNNPISFNRLT